MPSPLSVILTASRVGANNKSNLRLWFRSVVCSDGAWRGVLETEVSWSWAYPQLAQKWGKPGMLWFRTVETVFCPYCLSVLLKTKIKNFFAGEPLLTFFSFSQNSWGMQQAQTVLKWASSVCLFCFLQDNYLRIWNGSFLFRYVVLSILWVGFLDPSHVSSTLARRP